MENDRILLWLLIILDYAPNLLTVAYEHLYVDNVTLGSLLNRNLSTVRIKPGFFVVIFLLSRHSLPIRLIIEMLKRLKHGD